MNDLVRLLVRRWRWTAAGLVLAVGAAIGSYALVGPTYSYTTTVLLLPPPVDSSPAPGQVDYTKGNPLFYLGALNQARDILIGTMNSRDAQEQLATDYPGTSNEISQDVLGSSPVVVITGSSGSDEQARQLVRHIAGQLPGTLRQLQSGLGVEDTSALITAHRLTQDSEPAVSHKSQVRSAILAGGGCAVLVLMLVALLDALVSLRGGRHGTARGSGGESVEGDAASGPGPAPADPVRAGKEDPGQPVRAGARSGADDDVPADPGR